MGTHPLCADQDTNHGEHSWTVRGFTYKCGGRKITRISPKPFSFYLADKMHKSELVRLFQILNGKASPDLVADVNRAISLAPTSIFDLF